MLSHPTIDRLRELGLVGMVHALEEQRRQPDSADLSFEDRLAMLVDREVLVRDNKRLTARLRFAGLRQVAAPEDVDYRAHRGLDRAMFQRLAQGEWIERQQNLLITGPTGVGKTWLACALGQRACRDNRSVLYQRVPRMLEGLGLARGDGRYARMLKSLARVQVLILDDWGLTPLTAETASRPAGNQRRPSWSLFHRRYQPAAGRQLPCAHRRSHHRRRRARSVGSQCPSPGTERRVTPKATRREERQT
jgi:DNA replication protein DnaC